MCVYIYVILQCVFCIYIFAVILKTTFKECKSLVYALEIKAKNRRKLLNKVILTDSLLSISFHTTHSIDGTLTPR